MIVPTRPFIALNTVSLRLLRKTIQAIHDLRYYLEDRGNPKEGWLFLSHKGEQLDPRFISEAIKRIAEKTFGEEKAKEFQTRHLRDAYKNALQRAKLATETVDKLFGHKRMGAKEAYQLEQALIEEAYAQAFQYMSINSITQSTEDLREIRKTMLREVNETKKQFAGVILQLAEALQKSGSPEVLKTS